MIVPATLSHTPDGTPYSVQYGDVYHSAAGGLAQARHVFLTGNELPGRWQGQERFVIVETGFGLGLNFLASWRAWRDDPRRCGRLDFVSFEKHPLRGADLVALLARWPELADLAHQLLGHWPALEPGVHRLPFDDEQVVLTLCFGDAATQMADKNLMLRADAFYLDGFSPSKNPDLWSPHLFESLARHAAPGATLATWTVAGTVRQGLAVAGFDVVKAPGFGHKREMLRGRYRRETVCDRPLPP